jgi:hypothetical protein
MTIDIGEELGPVGIKEAAEFAKYQLQIQLR